MTENKVRLFHTKLLASGKKKSLKMVGREDDQPLLEINEIMRDSRHFEGSEGMINLVSNIVKNKIEPYCKCVTRYTLALMGRVAEKIKQELNRSGIQMTDETFKEIWTGWGSNNVKHTIGICRSNKTQSIFGKLKGRNEQ